MILTKRIELSLNEKGVSEAFIELITRFNVTKSSQSMTKAVGRIYVVVASGVAQPLNYNRQINR